MLKPPMDLATFEAKAGQVADTLKAIGNARRLMLLCKLVEHGEVTVSDLARVIGIPHERVGRAERNRIDAILRLSGWVRDGRFRTRDHNRDAARYVPPEHPRDESD